MVLAVQERSRRNLGARLAGSPNDWIDGFGDFSFAGPQALGFKLGFVLARAIPAIRPLATQVVVAEVEVVECASQPLHILIVVRTAGIFQRLADLPGFQLLHIFPPYLNCAAVFLVLPNRSLVIGVAKSPTT